MNEPVFHRPELRHPFPYLVAWSLLAAVQFWGGYVRGEDAQSPFALWDEGVPFSTRESLLFPTARRT